MTVFVAPADIRAAHARAGRHGLSDVERRRWQVLLDYADARPVDPTPARAAALAAGGDAAALHRAWLAEDVAAAAPLLEVFTGHHRDPEGGPPDADPELVARLTQWFATRGCRLARVSVIAGGFSRLMLDVAWDDAGRGVVRIEQGGMFATDGRREVAVLRLVAAHGYPVPAVLWEEPDPAVLGHPFFVMAFVPGAARTDAAGLDDVLRALARLHELPAAADVAALDGVAGSPQDVVRAGLERWHDVYRAAVPAGLPLLEHAFGWLRTHLRPTGPSVVVHGDPGPGNALQDDTGVTAVIDWEFAHAGDAAEDWSYLALIRGRRLDPPAAWQDRLKRVVGVDYDDATWRAWEAYNQVKGACVNLTALEVFRTSASPTPDLLAIGVAVHLRFLARALELVDGA